MMTHEQRAEIMGMLVAIGEEHKDPFSPIRLEVWMKDMERVGYDRARPALMRAIHHTHRPKLGEVMQWATGSDQDSAEVEGIRVLNAAKRHGPYASVIFDDPVTNSVISQGFGGWIKLCTEMTLEDEKWFPRNFAKVYRAFADRGTRSTTHLIGMHERNNAIKFPEQSPEICRIGDAIKIQQMLGHGVAQIEDLT